MGQIQGPKGESGTSGTSGSSGSIGTSGTSGSNGSSGTSGSSGSNGSSGTSGSNGSSGTSGSNGSSGTSGYSGTSGSSGTSGTSGTTVLTTLTGITSTGDMNVGGNLTVAGGATIGATQVYTWPTSAGNTGYVKLGTWTQSSFTGGGMLGIKLWLHGGYNSDINQMAVIEMSLEINNGTTPWATNQNGIVITGNSAVTGVATVVNKLSPSWGTSYQPITNLVVVQNSTTSYTIWAQGVHTYSENGMYQITYGPNASWSNDGTFQTGAPSYGSNYVTITPQATIVSAYVNAGTFVSLDNLKVTCATAGYRGLSIGAVSTNFTANVAGHYFMAGGASGGSSANAVTYTTSAAGAAFAWAFGTVGDTSVYIINDTTYSKVYRVTMMIGASYNNNFISIERLY